MTTSRTDIISNTAISYMRAMDLAFSITNTKPNTTLYAFFDGISVDSYITPNGGIMGDLVITDTSGQMTGKFKINDFTFGTGTKQLIFQDSSVYSSISIPGSTVSSATAQFTSAGNLLTTQNTETSINNVITKKVIENNVIGALGDPLAQSFFTHGVTGGVNITKIDIFFQSAEKTGSIPVTLEIRELVSGYPSPKLASVFSRVVIKPENILTSRNASLATSFVFDTPIFLPENRDWCFVLLSNSNKYNVWTAKIGEKSQETGNTVYEQPFIGSMYKSENNVTWTTDSTEDIKFIIHQAIFNSTDVETVLKVKANKVLIYGKNISVKSGSNIMKIKTDHQHGLRNSDKIRLRAPNNTSTYRGISASQLSGLYTANYIDDYTVNVQLSSGTFTSTGTIGVPGIVNEIQVDSGGVGYNLNTTVAIIGTCTTPAIATVQTDGNGSITRINITNHGSGYTDKPSVVLTGDGSGASLFLIAETVIQLETNRVYDEAFPRIANFSPALTSVTSKLKSTSSDYFIEGETDTILNFGKSMAKKSLLLSTDNNAAFLPGQNTTELSIKLSTENNNVSPLISLSETPTLECRAYVINNQTEYETISPTVEISSGSVISITVVGGGFGYDIGDVIISKPNLSSGVQATAIATLLGNIVQSVTITNGGSGYINPPIVLMGQKLSTPAMLISNISAYNSELLPNGGSAKSKYVTTPITLNTVSTGAVIYVNAFSKFASSFDVYIRTSLRSDTSTHGSLDWKMMFCDVTRNKSTKPDEYLDYSFYINNLKPFDVYDIKIVMRTTDRTSIPIIDNYRCIILAT